MKNLVSRIALVLLAVVLVTGLYGCGGSPTGPDPGPTPTPAPNPARLVITIEFQLGPNHTPVPPDPDGVVRMPANQEGRACTKVLAPQVPDRMFEGQVDFWSGVDPHVFTLTRNTNTDPIRGTSICSGWYSVSKGLHQANGEFTERGGDISTPVHQPVTARMEAN